MLSKFLIQALKKDLPYRLRSPFRGDQKAAVMVLLSSDSGSDTVLNLQVLLTKRSEEVESHKGQYAFPGGRMDPSDRDLIETALRECKEEVGLKTDEIEILGCLPPLCTPSGYEVTPVLGLMSDGSKREMNLQKSEVCLAFWAGLNDLQKFYYLEKTAFKGSFFDTDVFYVRNKTPPGEHRIWGMTGAILHNLLLRLENLA